tara:strand:+ start:842 stop:1465 length:624 start_codon:yes stop_codon:yes gene_type:complete
MSQRSMKYLNDNRIIYRKYPTDKPTEEYDWGWYYEDGTYGYYSLFHSKSLITSYKSLKWHLLTLWYLNPELTFEKFNELANVITYKPNGFITFEIPEKRLQAMIASILLEDLERAPRNRLRKIVFKDGTGLDTSEKLSIVGSIIGRGKAITQEDIYDAMLHINDNGENITISKIAKALKCTPRTIHRHMGAELKQEKDKLNIDNEKI